MVRLPRRLEEEAQRLSHTNRPGGTEQWIRRLTGQKPTGNPPVGSSGWSEHWHV